MPFSRRARALLLAGSVIGAVAPLAAAPAYADTGGNAAVQYCKDAAAITPDPRIVGACSSFFMSWLDPEADPKAVAATIQYYCTTYDVPNGEYPTVGDCVTEQLKAIKVPH